jgi:hypothetical protein
MARRIIIHVFILHQIQPAWSNWIGGGQGVQHARRRELHRPTEFHFKNWPEDSTRKNGQWNGVCLKRMPRYWIYSFGTRQSPGTDPCEHGNKGTTPQKALNILTNLATISFSRMTAPFSQMRYLWKHSIKLLLATPEIDGKMLVRKN